MPVLYTASKHIGIAVWLALTGQLLQLSYIGFMTTAILFGIVMQDGLSSLTNVTAVSSVGKLMWNFVEL